jgi:uncharacterized protein (DUF58 family)
MAAGTPIDPDTFRKIRRIQIKMDRLATSLLSGLYRSAFKGKGMEFEEVRDYQSGDDIRDIDWNVTARMGHPYVKRFREERESTVMLMIDISASTRFGTEGELKSTLIAEIGGALAFSAIKNQDKIGMILFSDKIDLYIPPKKGTRHVLRIIRELLVARSAASKTDTANALAYFGKVQKQRAICFLISDFLSGDFSKPLAPLAKKHDMIAIRIYDPKEEEFPPMDLVSLRDLESGLTAVIDTSSLDVRERLKETASKREAAFSGLVKRSGGDWISIATGESYAAVIRKYLKAKHRGPRP